MRPWHICDQDDTVNTDHCKEVEMKKAIIENARWSCAFVITIIAGSLGYPWMYYTGEKLIKKSNSFNRFMRKIDGMAYIPYKNN